MWKEFKAFALKGNLIDLAVGVIIGAAFAKIVAAFIEGIVMPLVGFLSSGQDFSSMALTLQEEVKNADGKVVKAAVLLKYGVFLTEVLNFLVVAFVIFMVIKAIQKAKKKEADAPPPPPPAPNPQEVLLTEIRDLLKNKA